MSNSEHKIKYHPKNNMAFSGLIKGKVVVLMQMVQLFLELFTGEYSQSVSQRDSQPNNDRLNDTFKTSDKNHDLLDGENDEDSEVYVSMRKKNRACIAISDGESQESELEVFQGAETSPTNENSGK